MIVDSLGDLPDPHFEALEIAKLRKPEALFQSGVDPDRAGA